MKITIFTSDDGQITINDMPMVSILELKTALDDPAGEQFFQFQLVEKRRWFRRGRLTPKGYIKRPDNEVTVLVNVDHIIRIDIEGD